MKKWTFFFAAVLLISCQRLPIQQNSLSPVSIHLDLRHIDNDTFTVEFSPPPLTKKNNIYQFAATAPGTYQTMNIGRFATGFRAFDAEGKSLPVIKLNDNQYKLSDPEATRRITYRIAETWDTPVKENQIYKMCGTSIEDDHILINPHAVIGYLKGLQAAPIELQLELPDEWEIGTALTADGRGRYLAADYDQLVDSPILMGRLSKAQANVDGTQIDIFTYSKTHLIRSEQIRASMKNMLNAASLFLNGLPVDRYTFLFHFESEDKGAWEHSYSSEYVYQELPWAAKENSILATASHEFFHIVTPLNIHSEVIHPFNFTDPQPSDHLWLYEGVTEWASDMILLQGGEIELKEYFNRLSEKLILEEFLFDSQISLYHLAHTSFTEEGQKQYANIYNRGAIVAGLLDLEIWKITDGEKGLRQLIVELAGDYGPDRPFSEKRFLKELADRTGPEIIDFFKKYVQRTRTLPIDEFYHRIGVKYQRMYIDSSRTETGLPLYPLSRGLYVYAVPSRPGTEGFRKGDLIHTINGVEVNMANVEEVMATINRQPAGTAYEVLLYRNGRELTVKGALSIVQLPHYFSKIESPSPEQAEAFRKWIRQ